MAVKPKTLDELGELQRLVMDIVWENGQVTVKDVAAIVSKIRNSEPAYTTILTVMQKLEKAGFIRHIKDRQNGSDSPDDKSENNGKAPARRRAYRYEAIRTRKYEQSRALRAFIERTWSDKELSNQTDDGDSLETISRLTTTRAKVLLFKHLLDDESLSESHLIEIDSKLQKRINTAKL